MKNSNIQIRSNIGNSYKNFEVCDSRNRITVNVYQDKPSIANAFDGWNQPTINWPGCGDKTLNHSSDFIKQLNVARDICISLTAGIDPAIGEHKDLFI